MKKDVINDWKKLLLVMLALAISIYIYILRKISWLNYYDKLYDILCTTSYISFVIVMITSIIFMWSNVKKIKFVWQVLLGILMLTLNIGIGYVSFSKEGTEVTCLSNIIKVSSNKENSYLIVNNSKVKVRCDEAISNNVVIDENVLYELEYRYLNDDEENGTLGSIDICNPIDNRK